jgi:hypothetical protein
MYVLRKQNETTRCRAVIPPLALHKLMCGKVLDYSGTSRGGEA